MNQIYLVTVLISFIAVTFPVSADLQVELGVRTESCRKGTLYGLKEKQKVKMAVRVPNANSGTLLYRYWFSNDGFKISPRKFKELITQAQKGTSKNTYEFEIPEMKESLSVAHITLGVVVSNSSTGEKGHASYRYPVTRDLKFTLNANQKMACRQVYPTEPIRSIYFNQNDTDMHLTISDAEQQLQSEEDQKSSGWSFSPSFFFSNFGFSLFGYSSTYLKGITEQTNQTVLVQVEHQLSPGDSAFIYRQKTRMKEEYFVDWVNECGQSQQVGSAYIDSWKTVYNVIKVDPLMENPYHSKAYGEEVDNTCREIDQFPQFDFSEAEFESDDSTDPFGNPVFFDSSR
ncbi:MAG: hypothetical protein KDD61_04585 [Bdellovibrionales bacterium]|nr:hypothetical protein [Bdellovibrionales bacterium]